MAQEMTDRSQSAPDYRQALKDLYEQVCSLRGYELTTDVTHYKAESNWQDAIDQACAALEAPVSDTAAPTRDDVLEEVLRAIAEKTNKYMGNKIEDYYLHGLWLARDLVVALKNVAPQVPAIPRLEAGASALDEIERQSSGPGPVVATPNRAEEGYPGITHDCETMLSLLRKCSSAMNISAGYGENAVLDEVEKFLRSYK